MKRAVTFIALSIAMGTTATLNAQQLANYSQFRNFQYLINPGAVEMFELTTDGDILDADVAYRAQWTGIEGAPRTATAGIQYTLMDKKMSLGGHIVNDAFGPTDYTQVGLQYAYHIRFERNENHFLSIGISAWASHIRVAFEELDVIDVQDDLLQGQNESRISPELAVGVYYQKKFGYTRVPGGTYLFAGLSADQLIETDVVFEGGGNLQREMIFHAYMGIRRYYDGRGYDFIEPVVWVRKGLNTPIHADLGCRVTMASSKFILGAAVGTDLQAHVQVGFRWEALSISYMPSFFLNNKLGQPAGMTHEISVGYYNVFW